MTPKEIAEQLLLDYNTKRTPSHYSLADVIDAAIRDAVAIERERCAQRLQAYKDQVQEDGAIWWPIRALDEFIAELRTQEE